MTEIPIAVLIMLCYTITVRQRKGLAMTFVIDTLCANMTAISSNDSGRVWKALDNESMTERKINNAIKSIQRNYQNEIKVIDLR